MDGALLMRRGVKELSLGGSNYAQVRISVDGTHSSRACTRTYSEGKTSSSTPTRRRATLHDGDKDHNGPQAHENDPDNPFGAVVKQRMFHNPKTGKKELSALNIVNERRASGLSQSLASQFLSKQSPKLLQQPSSPGW